MLKSIFTLNQNNPRLFEVEVSFENSKVFEEVCDYYENSLYVTKALASGSLFQEVFHEIPSDIDDLLSVNLENVEFRIDSVAIHFNEKKIRYVCTDMKGDKSIIRKYMRPDGKGNAVAEFNAAVVRMQDLGILSILLVAGLPPAKIVAAPVKTNGDKVTEFKNPIVEHCFANNYEPIMERIEQMFPAVGELSSLDMAYHTLQSTVMPADFAIMHFERFDISHLIMMGLITKEIFDAKFSSFISYVVSASDEEELIERTDEFNELCAKLELDLEEYAYKIFGSLKELHKAIKSKPELADVAKQLMHNINWLNVACAVTCNEMLSTTTADIYEYLFGHALEIYTKNNKKAKASTW